MDAIASQFLNLNNFQRAWEKVAENRGSAGVDGETIDNFARNQTINIYQLLDTVANGTYQPHPCKQVIIPKKNGTRRELKIPTVRDRIIQQALLNVVYPVVDHKFSAASFAYRPNLSYLNAVEKVAEWRDLGYRWVLDGDIVKFFLLFNNVLTFIIAEGLSPYLGNFHYGDRQKPYLAFDLMEEYRSVIVDSLVLTIINKFMLKPQDFEIVSNTGAVYLTQSARRVFVKQFEARMNEEVYHPDLKSPATYRHAIQLQVRRYKRSLLSSLPYEPFLRAV